MAIHLTGSFAVSGSVDAQSFTTNGQPLTSDPFPYTGDAQFNGSLGVSGSVEFAYGAILPAAWSAGGNLSTARRKLAGAGTQTAGLAFGGKEINNNNATCTEAYDGTSWSAGGALATQRYGLVGAGTQDAALAFGGTPGYLALTEEYNGTSWSAGGALATGRSGLGGAGTQNAGLAFAGYGWGFHLCTEEYNGTSWSAGGALSTARYALAGAGTQNAGLAIGGADTDFSTALSITEEYDGSSWAAGGALITARQELAGAGTQNAGLAFGGATPSTVSCTEEYDGTSWSTGGALLTARQQLAGAGTQNVGLAFGGFNGSAATSCTEEYNAGGTSLTKTFDYSCTTGQTTVSCLIETSAERYKSNIQPLGSQLSNIMNLQPVEFDWKTNKKHDIGFVADSVENVYPNLVSKNAQGEIEGMNYSKLVSALVKSVQEQQTQIQSLQAKIDKLNIN